MKILFEDESLLVVDKPAGVPVIPERDSKDCLQKDLEVAHGRLFVVHRLDKDTSGVILFARTADVHRRLNGLFESRQVEKTYLAWVLGSPQREDGVVNAALREFGSGRTGVDPRGKPASTRWRVKRRAGEKTLLEVQPATGRRHQIRVHLYSLGHPVLGDRLYGESRPVGGAPRLMLHALELSFPWDNPKPLRFRADPPGEFNKP
jgi:tRNA pseudouridine32 synthase / 23S rRNA pseudouridine746 synthase